MNNGNDQIISWGHVTIRIDAKDFMLEQSKKALKSSSNKNVIAWKNYIFEPLAETI